MKDTNSEANFTLMNADLKLFLRTYAQLADGELETIVSNFCAGAVRKGEHLLRQGETCKDLVFVRKGCIRLYYIKDGVEISVWFAFEKSSAIEIYSFISETPSNYYLEAIEDSEILYLPKSELNKLYDKFPIMHTVMRNFWEDVILHLIKRFTSLQTDSAEKRYLDLLNTPSYIQAIPQKYLASFIGVTPTSLSRIRRNIKNH